MRLSVILLTASLILRASDAVGVDGRSRSLTSKKIMTTVCPTLNSASLHVYQIHGLLNNSSAALQCPAICLSDDTCVAYDICTREMEPDVTETGSTCRLRDAKEHETETCPESLNPSQMTCDYYEIQEVSN
jgi:hypothetical protein